MGNWVAGVWLGVIAVILILFGIGWAQGTPGSPTARISGAINPSQAQTFQIQLLAQVQSTSPPNSIWQLGTDFLYTVTVQNPNGGTTTVALEQKVAGSVVSSAGSIYTLGANIQVTTQAICTTTNCAGTISNITIVVSAQSWGGALTGPVATIVFSSNPTSSSIPSAGAPSPVGYYGQAILGLVGGVGLLLIAIGAFTKPHPVLVGGGAILLIIGGVAVVISVVV